MVELQFNNQAGPSNTLVWVLIVWAMIFFSLAFIDLMLLAIVYYLRLILKALGVRK
jgi:hypothetical protein